LKQQNIGFPAVGAAFTTATGFFLTAECATDLSAAGSNIDIGNAAVAAYC
jgi:hypothetical protein